MVLFKSWKFCGVHFAPLLLPLDRRLQTLSVALWFMLAILIGSLTAIIFIYLILYTNYWWIPVLYLTWMIFDRKCQVRGGRPDRVQKWARNWSLWRFYCNYFPIREVNTLLLKFYFSRTLFGNFNARNLFHLSLITTALLSIFHSIKGLNFTFYSKKVFKNILICSKHL